MSVKPAKPVSANNPSCRFAAMYGMKREQVDILVGELNTDTFIDNIQLLFETPIENIISLRCYPFDVRERSPMNNNNDVTLLVNVVEMSATGHYLGAITQPLISLGELNIPKRYNNFLDYSPYTKIELYLPYIGFVNLDANEVMGKTLSIQYAVDYMTGAGTAFVMVDDVMVYTGEGKIGIDVPLGGRNEAEVAKNNLMTGISTAGGIISAVGGGPAGAVKFLASTAASVIQANQHHVTKGSIGSSANGFYAPQNAYVVITRPNPVEPSSYASQYGRPSGMTKQLQSLTGYTVVDSVHVEGITNGTQDEITEIERLLKSGVIL